MFLTIGKVLDASALGSARKAVAELEWDDGVLTAGAAAQKVKQNMQADLISVKGAKLSAQLTEAVSGNPIFRAAARPAAISPLLISKTKEGGRYGLHVDNAVMGKGAKAIRTDLSFTLFLSEPDDYSGGALALDLPGGVQKLKPSAGDMVLYPSTLIHQVEPVISGERVVAVGWVQSQIRSAEHRQILFDLEQVRATMRGRNADGAELLMLDKVVSNLLRQWVNL